MFDQLSFPEDVTPATFFEELLPQVFEAMISANPMSDMKETELSVEFNLTGEGGGVWTAIITDGEKIEVKPVSYDGAKVRITMDVNHWRDGLTGKIAGLDPISMLNSAQSERPGRSQYDRLRNVKGTVTLQLELDDGNAISVEVMFNGAAEPTATVIMNMDDYQEISSGKITPQQAVWTGKVRVYGNTQLVITAGTLAV